MGANVNTLRSLEGHLLQALERVRSLYPDPRPVTREPRGAEQKATLIAARDLLGPGYDLGLDALAKQIAARLTPTNGGKDRRFTTAKRALGALIRDGFLVLKDDKVCAADHTLIEFEEPSSKV